MVLFSATAQVVWTFANNTKYRQMIKQFVIEGEDGRINLFIIVAY